MIYSDTKVIKNKCDNLNLNIFEVYIQTWNFFPLEVEKHIYTFVHYLVHNVFRPLKITFKPG